MRCKLMHLSMGRAGLPQGIRQFWGEKWGLIPWGLIPYPCDTILCPCDTILCPKSPGHAFRFRHNFFEIFSLKHLRSRPCAKVVCQIPEGSDCFGSLIPSVSPLPLGENIDMCIISMLYSCSLMTVCCSDGVLPFLFTLIFW